jgi:hypothetical protein
MGLPGTHGGVGANPLGMILGANQKGGTSGIYSLFTKEGFSKTLQNLKGTVWNQKAFDDAGALQPAAVRAEVESLLKAYRGAGGFRSVPDNVLSSAT